MLTNARFKMIKKLIFISISVSILIFLFKKIEWHNIYAVYVHANHNWLILGFLISFISPFIITMRWHYALLAQDISLPFYRRFESIMIAYTAHIITPSKTGDVIKGFVLRDIAPISTTVSAVIAERLGDILVLLCLTVFSATYTLNFTLGIITISVLLMFSGFVLLIPTNKPKKFFLRPISTVFEILIRGMTVWKLHPTRMLMSCSWSSLQWLLASVQVYLFYHAMGINMPILLVIAIFPMITLISLLPITFSGLGIRDVAYIFFFSHYAPIQVNMAVSLMYFACNYIFTALAGSVFLQKVLLSTNASRHVINLQ